jgi:hypothetical protein
VYKVKLINQNRFSYFEIIEANSSSEALKIAFKESGFDHSSITSGYVKCVNSQIGEYDIQLSKISS